MKVTKIKVLGAGAAALVSITTPRPSASMALPQQPANSAMPISETAPGYSTS
jgi:hypothetical protein